MTQDTILDVIYVMWETAKLLLLGISMLVVMVIFMILIVLFVSSPFPIYVQILGMVTKTFEKDKVSTKIVRFLKEIIHYYYGWSFSFSLYCFDTEARLTSQCCNKYLHYWQPANLTHTHTHTTRLNEGSTSWMSTLLILNAYPTAWMPTLQRPPNLDLAL